MTRFHVTKELAITAHYGRGLSESLGQAIGDPKRAEQDLVAWLSCTEGQVGDLLDLPSGQFALLRAVNADARPQPKPKTFWMPQPTRAV